MGWEKQVRPIISQHSSCHEDFSFPRAPHCHPTAFKSAPGRLSSRIPSPKPPRNVAFYVREINLGSTFCLIGGRVGCTGLPFPTLITCVQGPGAHRSARNLGLPVSEGHRSTHRRVTWYPADCNWGPTKTAKSGKSGARQVKPGLWSEGRVEYKEGMREGKGGLLQYLNKTPPYTCVTTCTELPRLAPPCSLRRITMTWTRAGTAPF